MVQRVLLLAAVVCMSSGHAHADPSVWDRGYKHGFANGDWLCPQAHGDAVVKDGHFSVPWEVKDLDVEEWFQVGTIQGTVRPSGLTENVTVSYVKPSARFVEQLARDESESDRTVGRVRALKVTVKFTGDAKHKRELHVYTGGMCESEWTEDRNAVTATAATGTVDCNSGPYAVALWSNKQAYRAGDYTRIAAPGQPVRLFRCVDACKPGVKPVATMGGSRGGDDDDDASPHGAANGDAWSFFGECAGAATPAAQLPASGSPKWDVSYNMRSGYTEDWRCPHDPSSFVVAKGTFSIPWKLSTSTGTSGESAEDVTVGKIEGVIGADGTTTVRVRWTVNTLPPEVTRVVRLGGDAAMAQLRTAEPSIKFFNETGKMNPKGQGRRAEVNFGKGCEYTIEAKDFKPQQFREEDGWTVDCNPDQAWDSRATYSRGDNATVGSGRARHQYQCTSSPQCTKGSRPGSSAQWSKNGLCK